MSGSHRVKESVLIDGACLGVDGKSGLFWRELALRIGFGREMNEREAVLRRIPNSVERAETRAGLFVVFLNALRRVDRREAVDRV
jgi:hypothetical protein